jgi:hypothetical protein
MHIHDSRMTCEVCGNTRHLGNSCPETQEDVNLCSNPSHLFGTGARNELLDDRPTPYTFSDQGEGSQNKPLDAFWQHEVIAFPSCHCALFARFSGNTKTY